MKSAIIIFALLGMAAATGLQAQSLQIGPEFGTHFNTALLSSQYNDIWDLKSRLGVRLGVASRFAFDDDGYLGLFTRIGYTQAGTEFISEDPLFIEGVLYDVNLKMKMSYFDLSPMLEYRFAPDSRGFFASAGGYAALGSSASLDIVLESPLLTEPYRESEKLEFGNGRRDDLSRLDAGAALGIGWFSESPSRNTFRISLEARVGMVKWSKIDQNNLSGLLGFSRDARHFSIGLNIAYTFAPNID
jgi:hypothetical protein